MPGETPSFYEKDLSTEVDKPFEVKRPRYDLSKFTRYLGIAGGMAAALSGIEGKMANAAAEIKSDPAQERMVQETASKVIATNAAAMRLFPEKIIRETDEQGKTHLRFEAQVDLNVKMAEAIENSPILMGQVQDATAKGEKASTKISEIYKQRAEMVDQMTGLSKEQKQQIKEEMLAALSTTFRLAGHKLSKGEILSIGEQEVNHLDSIGDLVFAASEFSNGLYDDVVSLPKKDRAQFLGGCTETFVDAGVIGAMELVREKGIERK